MEKSVWKVYLKRIPGKKSPITGPYAMQRTFLLMIGKIAKKNVLDLWTGTIEKEKKKGYLVQIC